MSRSWVRTTRYSTEGAEATQEGDLEVAERVNVGVAAANGLLEDGVGVEQGLAADDAEDGGMGAFVLGLDVLGEGVAHGWVGDEFGVVVGDVHIGFGEGHLQIIQEGTQEGPGAVHLL